VSYRIKWKSRRAVAPMEATDWRGPADRRCRAKSNNSTCRPLPLAGDRRHRRSDTKFAGLITRPGDDPALARPADRDRLSAQLGIVPLLDGCVERIHVDVDDLALAWRQLRLVVVLSRSRGQPGRIFFDATATIRSDPSGSGRCMVRASFEGAVIQVSTSAGVVRITGIALGWTAPTSALTPS
jgi:hypothetical protein